MAKISEVIQIYAGMSSTVNLKYEYNDIEKNRQRMVSYKPIKSHREIIYRIARAALADTNSEKSFLLTGHYGTGKSHLLLMIANYFSQTLDQPELLQFFKHFSIEDKAIADGLKAIKGDTRHLVVIPDYDTQADFSECVLMGLEEAFRKEGIEDQINSIYSEAVRKLNEWENEENAGTDRIKKFSNFCTLLEESSSNYNSVLFLKNALTNYDLTALELFKKIFFNITSVPFKLSSNNIIEIISEVTKMEYFTERYKGIVVLFDEFGYALKNRKISVEVIQNFSQFARSSNKLIFVGALHKSFSSYASDFSTEEFKKVSERFTQIDLQAEGLEEIVGAIIRVKKNDPIYLSEVEPNMQLVYGYLPLISNLQLFSWLNDVQIQEKIIDAVYPLHPLAMACLLKLSTRVGSSNRTLFTFLSGYGVDENNKYSYKYFIENNEILENGILKLFTADLLISYFAKEININNRDLSETVKKILINYEASLKQLKDWVLTTQDVIEQDYKAFEKILKVILILELSEITTDEKNICFALNIQEVEKRQLVSKIKKLITNRIIFKNPTSHAYEFISGTNINWEAVINIEKQRIISENDYDIVSDILSNRFIKYEIYDQFLEAKEYNKKFSEDRRLLRKFETIVNFANDGEIYFQKIESELLSQKDWSKCYEGVVIYVIAETQSAITQAEQLCKFNKSKYIICVIPNEPISILDEYLNIKSAINIKHSSTYTNAQITDQSRLDESYIGDLYNTGYTKIFNDQRNKYLNGNFSTWYSSTEVLSNRPKHEQLPVCKFLQELFPKVNIILDDEFNKAHGLLSGGKKSIFADAINLLISNNPQLTIHTKLGIDKGEKRWLFNVLFQNQVLTKIEEENNIIKVAIEKDINKYLKTFPALAEMIEELKNKKEMEVKYLVNKYRNAPYGLTPLSLGLFISVLIRYFGDELIFKHSNNAPGDVNINKQLIDNIIFENNFEGIFKIRELSINQKALLSGLFEIFSLIPLKVNETPVKKEIVNLINTWIEKQPVIALSQIDNSSENEKKFLKVISKIGLISEYEFIFEELKIVTGYEPDDQITGDVVKAITDFVKTMKYIIENKLSSIEDVIFNGFSEIFNNTNKTYDDLMISIKNWYNKLEDYQLDLEANNAVSKPLIKELKNLQDIKDVIFNKIPASQDYYSKKVSDWTIDYTNAYLNKIKMGIDYIGQIKPIISAPLVECDNADIIVEDKKIIIEYSGKNSTTARVFKPNEASKLYISFDGKDPLDLNAQKEVVDNYYDVNSEKVNTNKVKCVSIDNEGNRSKIIDLVFTKRSKYIEEDLLIYKIKKGTPKEYLQNSLIELLNTIIESGKLTLLEINEMIDNFKNGFKDEN